jgi:hypothetical protein
MAISRGTIMALNVWIFTLDLSRAAATHAVGEDVTCNAPNPDDAVTGKVTLPNRQRARAGPH